MDIDPFLKCVQALHKHNWEYERHNDLIIRSCNCGTVEEGEIIEDPQLVSTTGIRTSDLEKVKWTKI